MPATEARKDPLSGRFVLVATDADPEVTPVVVDRPLAAPPTGEEGPPWVDVADDAVLDKTKPVDRRRIGEGLFLAASAAGRHERIVEDPSEPLESLPTELVEATLRMYRDRMLELADDNRTRQLGVVKNHGAAAGAVVAGSSSEVFGLPFVPDEMRQKLTAFAGHHRRAGSCLVCDMTRFERSEKSRVIEESLRHIAFMPWASSVPYEIIVAPKGHHPSYATTRDPELGDLAGILQRTLLRLRHALGGPSYRYALVTAPEDAGADVGSFHWHLVVRPVLAVPSALDGLLDYNPVAPEKACARLTKVEL